jgi:hypothetical protein
MHTVHLPAAPKKEFIAAAVGIIFSVDNYTADLDQWEIQVIDNFFEKLDWTQDRTDPKVDEVMYGQLMRLVDTKNRWVYRGSVTTPPCATKVYWNVVRKVYPVKQKYVDLFNKQLARGTNNLRGTGNWREIQEYSRDYHDLRVIYEGEIEADNTRQLSVDVAVLTVFTAMFFLITCCSFIMLYKGRPAVVQAVKNAISSNAVNETKYAEVNGEDFMTDRKGSE